MRHIEDLARRGFFPRHSPVLCVPQRPRAGSCPGGTGTVPVCGTAGVLTAAGPRLSAGCSVWSRSTATASVRCCCVQLQCRALPGAALSGAQGLSGQPDGACASSARRWGISCCLPMQPGTAYVFALEPAAKLICRELCQAGRTEVSTRLLEPGRDPGRSRQPERQLLTATVSSLRLDAVLSAMLHVQPRHRCGADRGGQGRDQPSAGGKTPCPGIRAGCVHCARQGPLPADCIARAKVKKIVRSLSSFNIKSYGRK